MVDIKDIVQFLDDLCQNWHKIELAAPSVRRDQTDVLRCVFWHHGLRRQVNASSAYRLEQLFEPDSFRTVDKIRRNRNKWQKYAKGQHIPCAGLVEKVEQRVPGSAKDLNHVLWQILRLNKPLSENREKWLSQLQPSLTTLIVTSGDGPFGQGKIRPSVDKRLLNRIEQQTSVDALAYMTILFLEAVEGGQQELAFNIANRLFEMLLMLGVELEQRKIGLALFDLYVERIFKKVTWKSGRFIWEEIDFLAYSGVLNLYAFKSKSSKKTSLSWPERVMNMRQVLQGRLGYDLKFALAPLYFSSPVDAELRVQEQRAYQRQQNLKKWGWNCINEDVQGRYPPLSLMAG